MDAMMQSRIRCTAILKLRKAHEEVDLDVSGPVWIKNQGWAQPQRQPHQPLT